MMAQTTMAVKAVPLPPAFRSRCVIRIAGLSFSPSRPSLARASTILILHRRSRRAAKLQQVISTNRIK
jgi:hypothetical protein